MKLTPLFLLVMFTPDEMVYLSCNRKSYVESQHNNEKFNL